MKTKKMTPATVAPVQRENTATVSRDGSAIGACHTFTPDGLMIAPFAGDDAK